MIKQIISDSLYLFNLHEDDHVVHDHDAFSHKYVHQRLVESNQPVLLWLLTCYWLARNKINIKIIICPLLNLLI